MKHHALMRTGLCSIALLFIPSHTVLAEPGSSPIQFTGSGTGATLFPFSAAVPTKQSLVIEELSVQCIGAPFLSDVRLFATLNGVTAQYTFAPTSLNTNPSQWISTQTTRIYADPSTTVVVGTGTTTDGANCTVSIAGHLKRVDHDDLN